MKIALVSSFVPFVNGGYRNIVEWLHAMLEKHGHRVERVYLPETDAPDMLFKQMMAFRWVDLAAADRIICFRPQAHLIPHRHKIVWFIHHLRAFYDLWDSPYRGFPDDQKHQGVRDALRQVDEAGLREAKAIFTNSRVVSERLDKYNNIASEILYPPVFEPERFHCAGYSNDIVCICRLEHHKRQHLLIEAMQHVTTPVRLRLFGKSGSPGYAYDLRKTISTLRLEEKVLLEDRWIPEEEKIEQLAHCLAVAYIPVDEDSYGYPSIEASHAQKPILTVSDSGGVLELVQDNVNGYVTAAEPEALARAMDRLYLDRNKTIEMGESAPERLKALNISWEHVLQRLLA
ncbi:glycosyltransferase family 4 protein [Burkholderia vietnamiensis]|uniref:glycosyltransferase family 4 protein n=1 Tax=Burkholderia vietnamiensis TaxID=60552 RepID=UPI0007586188|nr:glycosyltransferase family 4 protein [Burkholderia vietnamiensis]KVF80199.1 glycosyl transferase family 1 [Burkholderia vietnamiensis]KVF85352.1 glycosyl transferase family 1 [Burkholderia vietnamiensis]KVF91853.1 glycosyl transferase family 1 [Burkholderia vietnamiensis]KVG04597.1 glycosyl transferase family 1 [Burkholderia vietnamiensis]MBR8084730.1 glycosyltransferase family 4 protein [Burkholderia vietnamiensis]